MGTLSDTSELSGTVRAVRALKPAFLALVALPLLAACGGFDTANAGTPPTTTIAPAVGAAPTAPVTTLGFERPTTSTTSATVSTVEADPISWTSAKAKGPLDVFEAPGDSKPFRVLGAETILGTPTVVLVLGGSEAWLEVLLPGRPNGQSGWVRAVDVERYGVSRQVVIDLTARTLVVLDGDEPIFETEVGIGSPSSPTPVGTFFVTDAVRITNASGPWGPYAYGLSARSDTVTEFNGGDGIIGIHGTNRPTSIGEAQSLGCVRLPNDVMAELAGMLTVGSPVTIRA